jgi:hypothetical protein
MSLAQVGETETAGWARPAGAEVLKKPVQCQNWRTGSDLRFHVIAKLLFGTALDRGGHIDDLAGFVQRRLVVSGLMRTMIVIVPFVVGEHLAQMPLAVDQQVVQAAP